MCPWTSGVHSRFATPRHVLVAAVEYYTASQKDFAVNTANTPLPLQPTVSSGERLFPTLTAAQIARITAHGHRRSTVRGEVLVEVGDSVVPFFLVIGGEVQVVRPDGAAE